MPFFSLRYPLVVAPMAGGPTTPRLVAVSSHAGALGSLGAAYFTPAEITNQINEIRRLTDKPFAVNLFLPTGPVTLQPAQVQAVVTRTQPYRERWGLSTPPVQPPFEQPFDAQFEAVLAAKPAALSFIFGVLTKDHIRAAQQRNILLLGAATTLEETQQLADTHVDAITLQGWEAGGHRAIFDARRDDPNISTLPLLKACISAGIKVPLIAAGGLMNRDAIAQALAAGAAAVQLGTAFLACVEAGTSAPYRRALLRNSRETQLTRAFSGRLARSIVNRFVHDMAGSDVLPFPAQNTFTRHLRNASAANDSEDCLSLWSGTGPGTLWTGSAGDLIPTLFAQA